MFMRGVRLAARDTLTGRPEKQMRQSTRIG
jgi:hypothetical protein